MEEKGLIPSEELKKLPQEVIEKNRPQDNLLNVHNEMMKLIPLAGTIELDQVQKDFLFNPVNEEDVCIRPDGLVYLPWPYYVERLNKAFGISWAIIPKDMPKLQGNHMYWPFYLMIKGKLAGFAIGEQEYQPSNAMMSYSDASEGAKSNALMRLCKNLGISLELWKPSFIRVWKEKYAESFPAVWPDGKPKTDKNGKQKTEWRKKGQVSNGNIEEIQEIEPITSKTDQEMETFKKESGLITAEFIDELGKVKNIDALKTIWKNIVGGKKNLLPEHFQQLEGIKELLKEKLK